MKSIDHAAEQPVICHVLSSPKFDEHQFTVVLLPLREAWTTAHSERQLHSALSKNGEALGVADEAEALECLDEVPMPTAILITHVDLFASWEAAQGLATLAYSEQYFCTSLVASPPLPRELEVATRPVRLICRGGNA